MKKPARITLLVGLLIVLLVIAWRMGSKRAYDQAVEDWKTGKTRSTWPATGLFSGAYRRGLMDSILSTKVPSPPIKQ